MDVFRDFCICMLTAASSGHFHCFMSDKVELARLDVVDATLTLFITSWRPLASACECGVPQLPAKQGWVFTALHTLGSFQNFLTHLYG